MRRFDSARAFRDGCAAVGGAVRVPLAIAGTVVLALLGCGDGGKKQQVSKRDVQDVERILAQKSAHPEPAPRPAVSIPPGTHFTREDIPNEGGYRQLPAAEITDSQADQFLRRLKTEFCTCSCPHTIDQCLISDPACSTAHTLALQILKEVTTGAR